MDTTAPQGEGTIALMPEKGKSMVCTSPGLFGRLAAALIALTTAMQAEPARVDWEQPVKVASGEAHKGRWRMNASRFRYVDDPTVAISEDGSVAVAWADQSRHDIYFQLYAPDGVPRFEEPINVSRSPKIFSWLPRMVIAGRDASSIYVLWQEIVFSGGTHGGEIFFARSSDGGRTFSVPANLSNSIAGDGKGRLTRRYWHNGSLDLAIGPHGTLYAAWTEYEGVLWFSRSTDSGQTFSKPLRVASGEGAGPARGPSLAVEASGAVHLVWTVGEDRNADIHLAKSDDGGQSFGKPRTLFESNGHSDAPKITVDQNGAVHLVYAESPHGPFGRYHIRYARSNDGAQTFEKPREISGPSSVEYESSGFPVLSADGESNLYVLWELFPDSKGRPQGLGFTTSTDAGRTFALPTIVPGSADRMLGNNGSRQGLLMRKLSVNRAGAIAVANSTFKRNHASHVWLFRGHRAKP